jgi:hypothetical protein
MVVADFHERKKDEKRAERKKMSASSKRLLANGMSKRTRNTKKKCEAEVQVKSNGEGKGNKKLFKIGC